MAPRTCRLLSTHVLRPSAAVLFLRAALWAAAAAGLLAACGDRAPAGSSPAPSVSLPPSTAVAPSARRIRLGPDTATSSTTSAAPSLVAPTRRAPTPTWVASGRCPSEMVDVGGAFCVDRFEARLAQLSDRAPLAPWYSPDHGLLRRIHEQFRGVGHPGRTALGRTAPVPEPEPFQLAGPVEAVAVSAPGWIPSGYLSARDAERACARAGKRLCTPDEWEEACRGEDGRGPPAAPAVFGGPCNVGREGHPAALLYGSASVGHHDPRLHLQQAADGEPFLRTTGGSPGCASRWGDDFVFDMVGNLDEWVASPTGEFRGGFYSRPTDEGCDNRIISHPPAYWDYSLGTRCCRAL